MIMKKYDYEYKADNGKQFVLRNVPTRETHATLSTYEEGHVFGEYVPCHYVDDGLVAEENIPGWTTLKGYEVVYYHNGYRLPAGNPQTFPTLKAAEGYKRHYESYPWMDHELFIEEVEYEGVPLSESQLYNGKEVIDKEHYFGLDACEIGSYFTEDMVNDFMNMLPPACWRSDCAQIGEPSSHRIDENGNGKATYATFKRIAEGIWEYCGDCFRGENVKRGKELPYVR